MLKVQTKVRRAPVEDIINVYACTVAAQHLSGSANRDTCMRFIAIPTVSGDSVRIKKRRGGGVEVGAKELWSVHFADGAGDVSRLKVCLAPSCRGRV